MAKIHRATVTEADLSYVGSITIDQDLLDASGIQAFQYVNITNVSNGVFWQTYVMAGESGKGDICLNGPPARHFQRGDKVIILAEAWLEPAELKDFAPVVVFVDDYNHIAKLSMRPAILEDKGFVDQLLYQTMHRYVESTWPNDPDAHRQYYERNGFEPSNTRILQIADHAIGRLSTTRREDCIFIDELQLLPDFQSLGFGARVIETVLEEARNAELPVKLTVLTVNPACKLYLRMGFTVTSEIDHRFNMEHK